jgi:hypothetical protein
MPTFQEELLAKQKKIMDGVQYKSGIDAFRFGPNKGQSIQEELVEAVLKIAEGIPGAEVIQPPGVKTYARASAKVVKEYGGDWAKMKDLNRCTLVVPARDGVKAAVDLVKGQFMVVRHSSRLQYLSGGMTDPLNKSEKSLRLFRWHHFPQDRRHQQQEGRDPSQLSGHDVREIAARVCGYVGTEPGSGDVGEICASAGRTGAQDVRGMAGSGANAGRQGRRRRLQDVLRLFPVRGARLAPGTRGP